jgi:putative ABC transport system permease protein
VRDRGSWRAFAATQRQHDVAIRMALGAQRGRVVEMFLKQGGLIVTAGIVVGIGASVALANTLASQLYGVGHADVPTYLVAAALLGAAALVAVWIPARRAANADPMTVLRRE